MSGSRYLAIFLAATFIVTGQSPRDGYRSAYAAWRQADPDLEKDVAAVSTALIPRIVKAAQGAASFKAARSAFLRLRQLTLEGTFSDPFYGGNKNFAGWDLLRYPGPRLAVAPDDQKIEMPKPIRRSVHGASNGH